MINSMKTASLLGAMMLFVSCGEKAKKTEETAEEAMQTTEQTPQESEWTVLFDGTSFDGWKAYNGGAVPDEVWKLEDGAMVFYPPEVKAIGANYNLVTEENFSDFVLSLEWQISEAGNSGVFWGVAELSEFAQPYETGPEIQVLDNGGHPDAKVGTTHQAGALYDMVAPSEDVTLPPGEWNTMEITVDYSNERGQVVLNGTRIVEFPLGNEAWNDMVSGSKFAGWKGFGAYPTGKIGLQDHGDRVAYRNIKIKRL